MTIMGLQVALVFALALNLWLPEGSSAIGEGMNFDYDASSACSKPFSRTGRARLDNLPCDFSRENWCTIAGNAYPWHAVRRFVQENQGLMRRMYGDEKHISVLKTELEKNDVELELEDDHNHLYSEDASNIFRNLQFEMDYEFDQVRSNSNDEYRASREYRARSLNSGSSSKLDKTKNSDEGIPRRRSHPNETPTASAPTYSASTTLPPSTTSLSPPSSSSSSSSSSSPIGAKSTHRTKMTPITEFSQQSTDTTKDVDANATSTTPAVSLAQIAKIQNLSINEIPGQIDRFDADVDELTVIPELLIELPEETTLQPDDKESTIMGVFSSSTLRTDELSDQDEDGIESQQQQQFRPRPEYSKPEPASSMEGQLFQDVAAKQEPPVLKVRGINACPVKEEVVAPFWANNTRGEVLALLNLYPFEQYVHWEKCTDENKQMYCREGCKCEQQYRLHRMLAYDPKNECRGIFSDWFRFPSCCVCRCYDLPLEFRVTSRSPRLVQRQKVKVRAPRRPPIRQRYN